MKIPDKIRIGSMDYTVIFTDEVLIIKGRECLGSIDYLLHEIKIKNDAQDRQGYEQTLLHEIVHGIIRERNFDLNSDDEELKVDEIASGLHQLIKDNPDLFKS